MKARKIFVAIISIAMAALFCCACAQPDESGENNTPNEPQGLEYGFTASSGDPQHSSKCAYRSDTDIFETEDITLTFYYGRTYFSVEYELENGLNVPSFELYFTNDNDDEVFVRRVEENYSSEEFMVSEVYDANNKFTGYNFNHSEEITIPQEIFTENEGRIYFMVRGININMDEPEMQSLNGAVLKYKKLEDNKIQLFTNEYRG